MPEQTIEPYYEHVDKLMVEFGKAVVKFSRSNLSRKRKNATRDLWKSMRFRWIYDELHMIFYMRDYGVFVDQGVTGHGRGNWQSRRTTVHRSLSGYAFKTGPGKRLNQVFINWMRAKGVTLRDARGRFMTNSSAAFLIRRNVGRFGLEPTEFFSRPYEQALDRLWPELEESFAEDFTTTVNFITDKIRKR